MLIHCKAGISRSGAIVCAYLMWKNKWSFEEALNFSRSKRSKISPNEGFKKQLRLFEKELRVKS